MPFDGDVRRWERRRPERRPQQPYAHRHYMAVAMAAGMACWGVASFVMAIVALLWADTLRALWFFGAALLMIGVAVTLVERQLRDLCRAYRRWGVDHRTQTYREDP